MYTGLAMAAVLAWWPCAATMTPYYYPSLVVFIVSLTHAGYLQELETLERFGNDAKEYYARTPRIVFIGHFLQWLTANLPLIIHHYRRKK